MRTFLPFVAILFLDFSARAEDTLQQQYLAIYLKINDAEHQERREEYAGAAQAFRDCYDSLMKIHEVDPSWESALVFHRLEDCRIKIRQLDEKSAVGAVTDSGSTNQVRPSEIDQAKMETVSKDDQRLAPMTMPASLRYPWKTNILTTLFWIGEDSSHASAWNENWTKSNHGADDPDNRNGFASAQHASSVNPFYVALPFNDLAHPDTAREWLPHSWKRPIFDGKTSSACKDRWVCIKNAYGRTCYAQWEDVGPDGNDLADYVFGTASPAVNKPGLDVSPAVAQFLGLDGNSKAVTSWRFVDDQDVPPGQWLKYDEQAVIYSALHQIQKTAH